MIPSVETQLMFNEVTQNNYQISFEDFYTDTRVVSEMIVQHDIRSAQQANSPKYINCSHQTKDRTSAPDRKINIAILDHLDLRKYHFKIDSIRYPRNRLLIIYEQNDYFEQYKNF